VVVDIHLHGLRGRRFPEAVESTVYRVVQEALTNVFRHARATHVSVLVERRGHELRTIVEDDGCGFSPEQAWGGTAGPRTGRGLGLHGMRERAMAAGGHVDIESTPGSGSTLYLALPLPAGEPP
jgi:signal transduction histidine kinase